ncbi:MAG: MarR family transcriptional regulator [Clostridia bacterium]|nr:MarR family transcriptional regulator [Clostridia bacterium]
MGSRTKDLKTEKRATGNEKYLNDIFTMMRNMDNLTVADKDTRFNSTELRLLGEILAAKYVGKRLISTQLAKLLGITRSAISQIVNRLEEQGIVKRVADEVDRKIAYIEITEETLETYGEDLKICVDFVGRCVKKFGVAKFNEMCEAFEQFCALVEIEKADYVAKRKYKK